MFFQNSVLNKHIKSQDEKAIIKAYEEFTAYYHDATRQQNIRESKEEQFQEGFLRELFVKILGYTLNPEPDYNLTTELKNEKGAKKADGAILKDGKALGVIELKGTDTKDLDKINEQAFNYKNNHSACVYVITSNFEKLRFFIHNAVEHIEFNLFTLTAEEFKVLWLCLHSDNLLSGIPLKIKEESLLAEENITKQLYKDYSAFRNDLWQNMAKNHPKDDQLMLFKKTQKLLDRFLFIFFAEDSGLLPPNSITRVVNRWEILKKEDAYKPLYAIFRQYFGYIDKGRKGQKTVDDIFAYNGGLFQPDVVLDNIQLDDEIVHAHVMKLTNYDFQSEVDVNILGHIFENSLNEIENITAELEGQEVDKSKTKRKKDGVFYTPKYITKYIVDNTLGKLCEEKKTELAIIDEEYAKGRRNRKKDTIKSLDQNLQAYRNWLLNITICDPACGSGAFLNQALEFLIEEHAFIDELESQLLGHDFEFPGVENHILEKNIFGVDINEESVDIAKLSLWLRTAQRGRKLTTLNNNIKCGNSLIDDPKVAGDKAFKWQKEFPTVFEEKDKKAFHITTATHDSRTSQRMIDYKVRELRDNGTRPKAEPIWLEKEDELLITQTVAEIIKEDELNVMAYNICGDHLHLLLVCEEEEVARIVGKIKGKTSRIYNSIKGINPLVQDGEEKSVPLWTQKYGCKEITTEEQLWNTVEYIRNNREKHKLPPLSANSTKKTAAINLDNLFYSSYEHAFRTEYKGGFDVVIGNPPYGATLTEEQISFFRRTYSTVVGHSEVYYLFTEKTILQLSKKAGIIGFIIPNAWLSNKYASALRKLIINSTKIKVLINFNRKIIFEDANVETSIFILTNQQSTETQITLVGQDLIDLYSYKQYEWRNNQGYLLSFAPNKKVDDIVKKLNKSEFKLSDKLDISNGIKPYQVGYGINKEGVPLTVNDVKEKIYHSKKQLDSTYKKEIKGKGVHRYSFKWETSYIKWGNWLMSPKSQHYFEQPKILIRQIISDYFFAVLDKEKYYADQSLYMCTNFEGNNEILEFYLALLNSKLYGFYFRKFYSEEDDLFPKIKVNELKNLPVKNTNIEVQQQISNCATKIANSLKEFSTQNEQFSDLLKSKFEIKKLTTKLQNWHELEFKDFLKELKKAKVELSLSEEAEWMQYFNEQKGKAQALKEEIERVDGEIDRMVYNLYGLTEEEIKIVEGD